MTMTLVFSIVPWIISSILYPIGYAQTKSCMVLIYIFHIAYCIYALDEIDYIIYMHYIHYMILVIHNQILAIRCMIIYIYIQWYIKPIKLYVYCIYCMHIYVVILIHHLLLLQHTTCCLRNKLTATMSHVTACNTSTNFWLADH